MRIAVTALALAASLGAQAPRLFLQTAHAGLVKTLAVSPDGTLAATAGRDKFGPGPGDAAVRLWQLRTGFELRTFAPPADAIAQVAFSPRGRRLAAATGQGIFLWDVASARLLARLPGCASQIAFSPDGRFLASAVNPRSECNPAPFTLWDLAHGGRRWATLQRPAGARTRDNYFLPWSFAFAPNSRLLAGVAGFPLVRFDPQRRTSIPLRGALAPLVQARDGRMAAAAAGGGVVLLDARGVPGTALRAVRGTPAALTVGGPGRPPEVVTLRTTGKRYFADLWNAATGRPDATLPLASDFAGPVFHLSPDGRWLLEGGIEDMSGSTTLDLVLYDRDHPDTPPRRWQQVVNASAAFTPGGRAVVASTYSGSLWRLDLASGATACSDASRLAPAGAVAESGDRRWLAQAAGGTIELWELRSGMLSRALGTAQEPVGALRFLAGSDRLVSAPQRALTEFAVGFLGTRGAQSHAPLACAPAAAPPPPGRPLPEGTFGLWDAAGERPPLAFAGVAPLAAAADGAAFAVAELGGETADVIGPRGTLLRQVDAGEPGWLQSDQDHAAALALSGNGRWLAVAPAKCCSRFPVRLYRLPGGAAAGDKQFAGYMKSAVLAMDGAGARIAVASGQGALWLWDRRRNRVTPCPALGGAPLASRFLDARHLLLAAAPAGAIAGARDLKSCGGVAVHVVPTPGMQNAAFSPDGRLVYSAGAGGIVVVRGARTGAELARLVTFHNGADWIAVAPNGLFDGSDWAWSQLLWRFGGNTFDVAPVEAYFNDFFHPGLLAEIAAGQRPRAPARLAALDRRLPRVAILPPAGAQAPIAARRVPITVTVAEAPADAARHLAAGGVRDVRLFRNGALAHLWPGAIRLRHGRARLTATVALTAGANTFTAYAFNRDNIKSLDTPPLTLTGAPSLARKGTAIILAVGVNAYTNPAFHLRYAADDARSFAAALAQASAALGTYGKIEAATLLDAQATRAGILHALARLAPGGSEAAQPEDTVFLYFAGHGMAEGPRYYLLPHDLGYAGPRDAVDAAAIATLERHGISDLDLERALRPIDAGRIVLVIDACNSGQALATGDLRQGPMNSAGLAQLAYEKGMYILTASQAYQQAVESSAYRGPNGHGHGLLTYALVVRGLEQGDASRNGGPIALRAWLNYAVQEAPRLSARPPLAAARAEPPSAGEARSFGAPALAAAPTAQHPRVFYRREAGAAPFVIAPAPRRR